MKKGEVRVWSARRTGYVFIIAAMLLFTGGYVWAATGGTTTNPTGSQGSSVGVQTPSPFSGPTWTGVDAVVVLMGSTDTALGTQSASGGVNAIAGQQTALTTCALASGTTGTCTFGFQPAAGSPTGTEVTGDYAEQLQFTATQTLTAPTTGFDMEIVLSGGSLATQHFVTVYANAGTCTPATGQTTCTATITMELYIDLGVPDTATQPSIGQVVVTMNDCANAQTCP